MSLETVKRLERIRGPVNANLRTLRALAHAFETFGVRFLNDGAGRQCVCLGLPGHEAQWAEVEAPPHEPAVVFRAIYHSVATVGDTAGLRIVLDDILRTATPINAQLGLTGALLAVDGRFLQVLEGPRNHVLQVIGRIAMDGRHHRFSPLECAPAEGRRFGEWLMAGRASLPASASDHCTPAAFAPEALSPQAALDLLLDVCAEESAALA
ncbi:MAG: BLUF domain-containing protein [Pseudomonadota bacterium]